MSCQVLNHWHWDPGIGQTTTEGMTKLVKCDGLYARQTDRTSKGVFDVSDMPLGFVWFLKSLRRRENPFAVFLLKR
jgi:hypothetical protein